MNFKLKVWRQKDGRSPGSFKDYDAKDIPSEASFLVIFARAFGIGYKRHRKLGLKQ